MILVEGESADPAAVQVADRIVIEITQSRPDIGAVLGSETDLMARHKVGRPVFRQAAKILEERGVAFMRRGRGGGLVVAAPSADFAARALSILIESVTGDLSPLALIPAAVDNHLFLYSAQRLSADKCEGLRRLARRLDRLSEEEFLRVGAHKILHQAVRSASDEPALALANKASVEYVLDLIPYSVDVLMEGKGEGWRLTLETAEALVAGDVARLFECRRRQMEILVESWPQWDAIDRDPSRAPKINNRERPEFRSPGSQAERLAREILREIRLLGWKAGERIGGGAELMERYGAGNNILRQAVRMLQEHTAVEVERGRRGGLFVATPDRALAMGRAAHYLQQSQAAVADIKALLVNLLLQALDAQPPIAGGALRAALQRGRLETFGDLAKAMAAASDSPPLRLFVEILAPLTPPEPERPIVYADMIEALASGDRARRRRAVLACGGEGR